MKTEGSRPQMVELARALEADAAVVEPTMLQVRTEIPSYAAVDREQVETSVRRNTRLAARAIASGRVPTPEDIWEAEQGTLERLRAGIPVVDVLAGFRISIAVIEDRMIELAASMAIPGDDVVALTRLLRRLGDAFSARVASAYRTQGLAVAVAEQRRRDRWLVDLLGGTVDPSDLQHGAALYGLNRGGVYLPFASSRADPATLELLQIALTRQVKAAGTLLTVPTGERLIGLLSQAPSPVPGHLLALGEAVPLEECAMSFALAEQVLAAAGAREREGVWSLADLGWRIGVPASPSLADLVRERYLMPLRRAGAFGVDVEQVLRAYLDNERSIPRTAAAMHAHVNTVRYRLSRFEELTGRSLAATDTLVELSWALALPDM